MDNKNETTVDKNSGTSFVNHQQAIDNAKNERIKSETDTDKLDPETANNPARRNLKTDVSQKSTGGGKQSSPGD
ncbi:hypothetical protein [Chryseosolibacter indicus]|uniref:Uncharacterized protein n=1 Tax=Chryseosolibacter indicus TaxID=2782351 RepID=A0ABS5VTE8_9BACT|nr:hypothetical protein [Chryseosolibacter indicus]MBT1704120.1 hypothetical protein [Chryseosolibacter indicus]